MDVPTMERVIRILRAETRRLQVPVVGVVFDPLRGDLYTATAGGPARLNGALAKASTKDALGDLVVSLAILGYASVLIATAPRP